MESIKFFPNNSADIDGKIIRYSWVLGDGNVSNEITPTHSYFKAGIFNITLTVTDDDGASNSTTVQIIVLNRPPIASINASRESVHIGEGISFRPIDAGDPDGRVVKYVWDFGDNTTFVGENANHRYTAPGTYQVKLKVTDDDGASALASVEITVTRPPEKPAPVIPCTTLAILGIAALVLFYNGLREKKAPRNVVKEGTGERERTKRRPKRKSGPKIGAGEGKKVGPRTMTNSK